jgi:hypothetical protein
MSGEIARTLGFAAFEIGLSGVRPKLDRCDKRMNAPRRGANLLRIAHKSKERMHEEYVIALMKPIGETESHEL